MKKDVGENDCWHWMQQWKDERKHCSCYHEGKPLAIYNKKT